MTKTYTISLYVDHRDDPRSLVLTLDGIRRDEMRDPHHFINEAKARNAFDDVNAEYLVADGFNGYHAVHVYLIAHSDDGTTIIAEKMLTVDTAGSVAATDAV